MAHEFIAKKGLIVQDLSGNTSLSTNYNVNVHSNLYVSGITYLTNSTVSGASLNIAVGDCPLNPNNGDVWNSNVGYMVKTSGYVKQLDYDSNTVGSLQKISFTNNLDGSIDVPDSYVFLYSQSGWTGNYRKFLVNSKTGITLTDLSINYLYVDYNGGNPTYLTTTNPNIINNSDKVLMATMSRENLDIHFIAVDWGLATAIKTNNRSINIKRFERTSGLILSESPTRVINISSGVVYYGTTSYIKSASSSISGGSYFYYHSGGVWTKVTASTYNNYQYDDGNDLQNLTNPNRYAVNWVYKYIDADNLPQIAYVLGNGDYDLSQAVNSSTPSIPTYLDRTAILVGRIIVKNGNTTAQQIDSAFETVFAGSTITVHNNLSGLQGGDIDEYYHLTLSQYNNISGYTQINVSVFVDTGTTQSITGQKTFINTTNISGTTNITGTTNIFGNFNIMNTGTGYAYYYSRNTDFNVFRSTRFVSTVSDSYIFNGPYTTFNDDYEAGFFRIRGYNSDALLKCDVQTGGTRIEIDSEFSDASLRFFCSSSAYQEISWSEDPREDKLGIWGSPYTNEGGIYSYELNSDLIYWNTSGSNSYVSINQSNKDTDFIIRKNSSGNAYVYDAGLDKHTFYSNIYINSSATYISSDGTGLTFTDSTGTYTLYQLSLSGGSSSVDTSILVTTGTTQIISGLKTFTNVTNFNNNVNITGTTNIVGDLTVTGNTNTGILTSKNIIIPGSNVGYTKIIAYPNGQDITYILPPNQAVSGNSTLINDGNGNLQWSESFDLPDGDPNQVLVTVSADTLAWQFREYPLTFQNSLFRSGNTINLLNDSTSPGNNKSYSTDSGGTKGWYDKGDILSDINLINTNWVYFGDQNTDGTFRIGISSGNFVVQKRESGVYNTKGEFS